jgi:hypothetical protein
MLSPLFVAAMVLLGQAAWAADHSDAPRLRDAGRADAQITDLHAFTNGDRLVLSLCLDQFVPPEVTEYRFASDLTVRFEIDNHSRVSYDSEADILQFGGTIVRPGNISPDISLEVTFDHKGRPKLKASGVKGKYKQDIRLFAGLRDDPFIRRPRAGRNVAAVVIELPLAGVVDDQPELLIWATTKVPEFAGPVSEHAGRALRSMFNEPLNQLRPRDHLAEVGVVPDVMIYNTSAPARYPNGRELADDVVDLTVDIPLPGGTLPGEGPTFPTANDVPFLEAFPYLAPPHGVD